MIHPIFSSESLRVATLYFFSLLLWILSRKTSKLSRIFSRCRPHKILGKDRESTKITKEIPRLKSTKDRALLNGGGGNGTGGMRHLCGKSVRRRAPQIVCCVKVKAHCVISASFACHCHREKRTPHLGPPHLKVPERKFKKPRKRRTGKVTTDSKPSESKLLPAVLLFLRIYFPQITATVTVLKFGFEFPLPLPSWRPQSPLHFH